MDEFVRASWYVQKQQVNGFQPPEELYCVATTYRDKFHGRRPWAPASGHHWSS